MHHRETLGHFIKAHGYSDLFQRAYLIPICSSIWSCPSERVLSLSAYSVLIFCHDHHLLQLFGQPQYLTAKGYSRCYVSKVTTELENRHCQIKSGSMVESVSSTHGGCSVLCMDGSEDIYDGCIISVHAPDALKILGQQSTDEEMRILDAFQYVSRDMFLHHDKSLMPHNPSAWSSQNFIGNTGRAGCVTYWLNLIQNLGSATLPFFVTLSPPQTPNDTLLKWTTSHPIPSVAAVQSLHELEGIQGSRKIWFSGIYLGHGFHEDAYKAGVAAAHAVIGNNCPILRNKKLFVPTLAESGARHVVTRFLRHYIMTGCLLLLEEGGATFLFEGTKNKSQGKTILITVHNSQFFWKVATGADIGLASAYIDGDLSFVDKQEGLLDFLMMLIDNRDLRKSSQRRSFTRDWWIPQLFMAAIGSAQYLLPRSAMNNTIAQARRNISQHYDLSNELFSIFLGESMIYSCAIFESEEEDLKAAQLRKVSRIIEKLRVNSSHEVLEIGCGWAGIAVEVVKQTGCKYTGVTLSEEQLKYCTWRAKEAGLEDNMTFLLCDYRQLARTRKFDRIVCVGMFEAVGHEYMEEFFSCCDSYLAEDGVFVLQTITIPDERYDECRRNPEFLTQCFFPGVCLPSLSRITSVMATACASRLCVEHMENIGRNYYLTMKCWRDNFMARRSEVLELGFDEKFFRKWEYSFNYCAAGFKSRSFGTYQIVFYRPGRVKMFGDDRPKLALSGY